MYFTGREIPIKLNFVTYEYQSNIYFGMFYCQKLLPETTSNRRKYNYPENRLRHVKNPKQHQSKLKYNFPVQKRLCVVS